MTIQLISLSIQQTGINLWIWNKISLFGWEIPIFGLFMFILLTAITIALFFVLKSLLKRSDSFQSLTPDVFNAIFFVLRFITGVLILVYVFAYLNINSDYSTMISGVFFTAIAFANMKTINNLIAGVYISILQPFTVGDYIEISGLEGIITEISLYHIRIHHRDASETILPNTKCLGSKIINYTISIEKYKEQIHQVKNSLRKYYEMREKLEKQKELKLPKKLKSNNDLAKKQAEQLSQKHAQKHTQKVTKNQKMISRLTDELQDLEEEFKEIESIQKSFQEKLILENEFKDEKEEISEIVDERDKLEEAGHQNKLKLYWERFKLEEEEMDELLVKQRQRWKNEKEKIENTYSGKELEEKLKDRMFELAKLENEERKQLKEKQRKRWEQQTRMNEKDQEKLKERIISLKNQERQLRRELKRKYRESYQKLRARRKHSIYVDPDRLVRYTFILKLPLEPERNAKILDSICESWTTEFELKPRWEFYSLGSKIEYQFTVMTPDPYDIIHFYDEFVEDVYEGIFGKEEE